MWTGPLIFPQWVISSIMWLSHLCSVLNLCEWGEALHCTTCARADLHKDPAQSEPSSRGQSDGGTTVSHQLLWHRTLGVVDHSASGTHAADFISEITTLKECFLLVIYWFTFLQGGQGNPAQKELTCLFNSIASFYHPSNNGRWQVKPVTHTLAGTLRELWTPSFWFITCHSGLGWLSSHCHRNNEMHKSQREEW